MKSVKECNELWARLQASEYAKDIRDGAAAFMFGYLKEPSGVLTHDIIRNNFYEQIELLLNVYDKRA